MPFAKDKAALNNVERCYSILPVAGFEVVIGTVMNVRKANLCQEKVTMNHIHPCENLDYSRKCF